MSDRMYEFTVLEEYVKGKDDVKFELAVKGAEDKYNRLVSAYRKLRASWDYYHAEYRKLVPEEGKPASWDEQLRKRERTEGGHKDLFN